MAEKKRKKLIMLLPFFFVSVTDILLCFPVQSEIRYSCQHSGNTSETLSQCFLFLPSLLSVTSLFRFHFGASGSPRDVRATWRAPEMHSRRLAAAEIAQLPKLTPVVSLYLVFLVNKLNWSAQVPATSSLAVLNAIVLKVLGKWACVSEWVSVYMKNDDAHAKKKILTWNLITQNWRCYFSITYFSSSVEIMQSDSAAPGVLRSSCVLQIR